MYKADDSDEIRSAARRFEEALPAEQRKRLGQYFTGIPLGRLLAHLVLSEGVRSVADPMAGHGDLLDAASDAARVRGLAPALLAGIEIDDETGQVCRERLRKIGAQNFTIISGSAFDQQVHEQLPQNEYDLVITNPPYVRYQGRNGSGAKNDPVRSGLARLVDALPTGADKSVWAALARGYSGLADLSVPSWLIAGLMVRPGGRLAIVAPATWRTRDYGDSIRYFLLRAFALEYIVEDTQPGWFSDALVRTHLIVARRLAPEEIAQPLFGRREWPSATWVTIAPQAAETGSLVGAAFAGDAPEAAFAAWLAGSASGSPPGVQARPFDLREEWNALRAQAASRPWFKMLESGASDLPLFAPAGKIVPVALPEPVRDIVSRLGATRPLMMLEESGIRVGQGLRTGCNWFFYVDACGTAERGMLRVKASRTMGGQEFSVPENAIRPVLRKQAELALLERGQLPPGRVLDLRAWILPEDESAVIDARETYRKLAETPPRVMPAALAAYVRRAAGENGEGRPAPELSAVRTNSRAHRPDAATPRYWYMLPDFAPRHVPHVFVARIIHGAPWVECNLADPILIDANFSTLWAPGGDWTPFALKALLNSAWCRLLMEALGTPLGGGALKLEAAHLRRLALPPLDQAAREELDAAGQALKRNEIAGQARIDAIILAALCGGNIQAAGPLTVALAERAESLRRMRLRTAA